jgi:immunity protein, SdpI family
MNWRWKSEVVPWAVIAAMWLASAVSWSRAPERLPVHWNLHGEVDRWGGRVEALLVLPLIVVPLYLLLTFLPRLDPGRANYERFAGAYRLLRVAVLLFLGVLHAQTLAPIYGVKSDAARVGALASGLLVLLLGGVMGKLRPNWFVGIRTPWTLSSKLSWMRTHRLGGWLFLGTGLVVTVLALVAPRSALAALMIGLLGSAAITIVYSYLVWRGDPDRQSPAGTAPADSGSPPS